MLATNKRQDPPGTPAKLASAESDTHHSYDLKCRPAALPVLKNYATKF